MTGKEDCLEPWEKMAKVFFAVEAWFTTYIIDEKNTESESHAKRGAIVSALIGVVTDEKAHLPRSQAIGYLGYMADEQAVPILRECLQSESALERQAAALALARLAPVLLNQIAGVLRDLDKVLMDPVSYVRDATIFSRKYIVHHADKIAREQEAKLEKQKPKTLQ